MFRNDIKSAFNKRAIMAFVFILLLGTGLGILFGSYFKDKGDNGDGMIRVGVVDLDQSEYSSLILDFFSESVDFSSYIEVVEEEDVDVLEHLMEESRLDLYIIIPARFVQNIINIVNTPIEVYINQTSTVKSVLVNNLLSSYEKYIKAVQVNCVALYDAMVSDGLDASVVDLANFEISLELVSVAVNKGDLFRNVAISDMVGIPLGEYYLYVMLYLVIAYIAMAYGLRLMKDYQSGLYARLVTTGTDMTWFFIGKQLSILAAFALAALTMLTLKGVAACIMVLMLSMALFAVVSSMFATTGSYLLASNLGIMLSVILGGGIIPILFLPRSMARVARFMPNYWFVMVMHAVEAGGGGMVVTYMAIMAGVALTLTCTLSYVGKVAYSKKN